MDWLPWKLWVAVTIGRAVAWINTIMSSLGGGLTLSAWVRHRNDKKTWPSTCYMYVHTILPTWQWIKLWHAWLLEAVYTTRVISSISSQIYHNSEGEGGGRGRQEVSHRCGYVCLQINLFSTGHTMKKLEVTPSWLCTHRPNGTCNKPSRLSTQQTKHFNHRHLLMETEVP